MRTTTIEKILIDEIIKLKIPYIAQKGVDFEPGYCRSKYSCKCGVDKINDDEWEEGEGGDGKINCSWFQDGHYKYYIDIYINLKNGLAIEIDDKLSHSTKLQIESDKYREERIKVLENCDFLRFTAQKVFNNPRECIEEIKKWIKTDKQNRGKIADTFTAEEIGYLKLIVKFFNVKKIRVDDAWYLMPESWKK